MELQYPFEFNELLITDGVLNALGFGEYWGGSGDYGERSFGNAESGYYRIMEIDESEDPDGGYGYTPPMYQARYYQGPQGWASPIYFLHELYENIKKAKPELLNMFIEKTKEKGVNMYPYIQSYLEFIEKK